LPECEVVGLQWAHDPIHATKRFDPAATEWDCQGAGF
jgi:hypothetical protein